jgi:hypothetical protein
LVPDEAYLLKAWSPFAISVNNFAVGSATCEQTISHELSAQHTQLAAVQAPAVHVVEQSLPPEAVQHPHWLYVAQFALEVQEFHQLHASD